MNYFIEWKDKWLGPYGEEKLMEFISQGKLKSNMNLKDESENVYPASEVFPDAFGVSKSTVPVWNMVGFDGNTYGPYTKEELQSFIVDNRVTPETVLYDEGGNSLYASQLLKFPTQAPTTKPPVTEAVLKPNKQEFVNNSGNGAYATLPSSLKGLNWGAFFLNWIWGLNHKCWLSLLSLIPYVGFIMCFVLLFKGNEWAWQNRRFASENEFKEVQKKWLIWGLVIFVINIFLTIIYMAVLLPALSAMRHGGNMPY